MSELKKTRDVATYQKLSPPKSLQGEEDAEVTWDLIVKRYPNAAPLLCQMETVIERAEVLLDQLRSPKTHNPPEGSSSFDDDLNCPPNVDQSAEVSMISEQDSRLASDENLTPEIDSVNTTGSLITLEEKLSADNKRERIFSIQTSPDACSSSSMVKSNSKSPIVSEVEIKGSFIGEKESSESTPTGELESSQESMLEEKSSSLEAWGRVVGENIDHSERSETAIDNSSSAVNSKEDSVSEHTRRLSAAKNGPMHQIPRSNILGKKEEMTQRFAGTIATPSKIVDTARAVEQDEEVVKHVEPVPESFDKNINEGGERAETGSSVVNSDDPGGSIEACSKPVKNEEVLGNGDEVLLAPRSPVEILDEYSKICGVNVEYKNMAPSCSYNKNVVVKCSFAGFAFEACAQTKKSAKKDAAAKLLRCLVGRQIDDENMTELKPLTRKQIEEIISLGNGGEYESAVRKLYKICLELKAPEPIYTVQQGPGIVGNRYTVKCAALGITTSGYGIRLLGAKKVAADELVHTYYKNRSPAR